MKFCNGPLHLEGIWLPATTEHFYKRKGGLSTQFLSRCIQCRAHKSRKTKRQIYGYAPVAKVRFIFVELEHRVGRTEAARRINFKNGYLKEIIDIHSGRKFVEKETVRRAMEELLLCRLNDEVRHKKHIQYGSAKRGLPESSPKNGRDYYKAHGDSDTERRRTSTPRP